MSILKNIQISHSKSRCWKNLFRLDFNVNTQVPMKIQSQRKHGNLTSGHGKLINWVKKQLSDSALLSSVKIYERISRLLSIVYQGPNKSRINIWSGANILKISSILLVDTGVAKIWRAKHFLLQRSLSWKIMRPSRQKGRPKQWDYRIWLRCFWQNKPSNQFNIRFISWKPLCLWRTKHCRFFHPSDFSSSKWSNLDRDLWS